MVTGVPIEPEDRAPAAGPTNAAVVLATLALGAVASIAAAWALSTGAPILLQGGAIAIAAGSLAVASRRVFAGAFAHGEVFEERWRGDAPRGPITPFLSPGAHTGPSRRVLLGALGATMGVFSVALLIPLRGMARGASSAQPATGWADGVVCVDDDGTVLTIDSVPAGGQTTVWPDREVRRELDSVVLVRVAEGTEGSVEGLIGYSKVCTHAGCPVGLFSGQAGVLYCPCHQAEFDATAGAAPLRGPAPRPLPRLPLRIADDGTLVAAGDFDAPVGPALGSAPGRWLTARPAPPTRRRPNGPTNDRPVT